MPENSLKFILFKEDNTKAFLNAEHGNLLRAIMI